MDPDANASGEKRKDSVDRSAKRTSRGEGEKKKDEMKERKVTRGKLF